MLPSAPSELSWDARGFYFIPEIVAGVKRADRTLGPGLAPLLLYLSAARG